MADMKKCTLCKKEKELTEFSFNGGKYRKSRCKLCHASYVSEKRRTEKRYYLGDKWGTMLDRCRSGHKRYGGMTLPSKDSFVDWAINRDDFCNLFRLWQISGWDLKESPSIDRINNEGQYTFDNMQFITQSENSSKDKFKYFELMSPDGVLHTGTGITSFCEANGLNNTLISAVLHGKRNHHKKWTKA